MVYRRKNISIMIRTMVMKMKKILIFLIRCYQKVPGPWHRECRFVPTCSNYAIEAINNYGSIKGGLMALKRIGRCNPFGGSGYDPVPMKYKKEKRHEES